MGIFWWNRGKDKKVRKKNKESEKMLKKKISENGGKKRKKAKKAKNKEEKGKKGEKRRNKSEIKVKNNWEKKVSNLTHPQKSIFICLNV